VTHVATTPQRPRRQSPAPARRRGDLLDAAAALFAERGIEATPVAAIAEAAGVAKGSFYRYFPSREALMAALKERFVDGILDAVGEFAARIPPDDWWALTDEFVARMFEAMLERRHLIRVFDAQPRTEEAAQLFRDAEDRVDAFIAGGIEAGVAAGVFRVADPEATAMLLQRAVSSAAQDLALQGSTVDEARVVAAAQRLVRAVLAGG
jgi:AcrR family transcriptional regulator